MKGKRENHLLLMPVFWLHPFHSPGIAVIETDTRPAFAANAHRM
jgi:hypothetical protein